MSPSKFLEKLTSGQKLVLDGATGTNLQARGLPLGRPSDEWVLDNPDEVLRLHRDFLSAGSDIILTNSFGSSRINLARTGMEDRFERTNQRAAGLARQAAAEFGALVGGSLGPLGEMVEPLGTLTETAAEKAYAEQAHILSESGVDLLVIETQFDLTEAAAAVRGVRSVTDLPLVCSFSYDRGTRTMMGTRPTQMAKTLASAGVSALGINCGRSLEDNLAALAELRAATSLPIWFKPNAGLPKTDDQGKLYYDVTPEIMGGRVSAWFEAGAGLVGGCCGTSPEHLQAIARAVKG
jgi:5-methyltetrahydrofolate--homocysteine methyltransferase